jgi:hypothetical protein
MYLKLQRTIACGYAVIAVILLATGTLIPVAGGIVLSVCIIWEIEITQKKANRRKIKYY